MNDHDRWAGRVGRDGPVDVFGYPRGDTAQWRIEQQRRQRAIES